MSAQLQRREAGDASSAARAVEGSSIGLDQVFEILKNRRRRRVLTYLAGTGEPASLSELAEDIAAIENDKEIHQITSAERKRVYVALYQCHLPKMAEVETVTYNKPRGTIEIGENYDVVVSYLDCSTRQQDRHLSKLKDMVLTPVAGFFGSETASQRAGSDDRR